jgi:hypothetical protein
VGFFSPWFLAGMAAVALPLWLHLLRQYKRTPQPFSSLMFWERRVQSSIKHRRLRYLALLAMRMALLLLLALAFANPFIYRTSQSASRRRLTIVAVDRSFSMRHGNRMETARAEARRVLDSLRGQDLAQVMAVDSHVENLTTPTTGKSELRAAVDSLHPNDQASSFGEFARSLRVVEQSSGMRLDVHFISDMQQTSMPPSFRDLQAGAHTSLALHSVGKAVDPNWAVENVQTVAHVYDPSHTRLTATLAGWQTAAATRRASLVLDGKIIASKDVAIPGNGRSTAEFLGFNVPYGPHRGEIRIEPSDNLPGDDTYPFAVERSDPRPVLFLYSGNRFREAFFYKAAMESSTETGLTVQPSPVEQALNQDFSKYAFVVLSDIGDLGEQLAQALCGYVQKGGAALIVLGPATGRVGRVPLSNDRFSNDRQAQGAGFVDGEDPALAGAGRFENVQFSEWARLTPKRNAKVIARLAGGSPLLVEQTMGEGHTLTFASTIDSSTNDFPIHSSFLPFVIQTGHFLAGFEDRPPSLVAGSDISLRRVRGQGAAADVIGPDSKHKLSLSEAATALSFPLDAGGFYEVQRADGHRLLLAVHPDRRESDLKTVPDETLKLWRNTGDAASAGADPGFESQTLPWSLWRYVLFLVLVAALVESVFASRYLEKERQTA